MYNSYSYCVRVLRNTPPFALQYTNWSSYWNIRF
jgi:hypothetical protein